MTYTIIVNKKSYTLPKRTVSVIEKLDEAIKVDSIPNSTLTQRYQKLLDICMEILGAEQCESLFGALELDEIDVTDIELAILKIKKAYEKPIEDYQSSELKNTLTSIPFDKISQAEKLMASRE